MNSFTCPRLALQTCMLRCAQRLTSTLIAPSSPRTATTSRVPSWLLEIAGVGNFGFEADIQPVVRAEDCFLFAREDGRIGIDPVRYTRTSVVRPGANGF